MNVCGWSDEVESVRGMMRLRQRRRKTEEEEETAMRAKEFRVIFSGCCLLFPEKLERRKWSEL